MTTSLQCCAGLCWQTFDPSATGLERGRDSTQNVPGLDINSDAVLWGTTVNVQTCMNVFR